jgi:hypothetical protein
VQVAVLVIVLLDAAVVALLVWRLHILDAKERALRAEFAELTPAAALPPPLEEAFRAGRERVLTVEILNPLELARAQHRLAGPAGAVAPSAVRAMVYEQAARITRAQLAERGVAADVQIHVAG